MLLAETNGLKVVHVDIEAANWTNTIGATELITVWKDPDFDPARRNLGVVLSSMGRGEEAVAFFEEALRKRPDSAGGRDRPS